MSEPILLNNGLWDKPLLALQIRYQMRKEEIKKFYKEVTLKELQAVAIRLINKSNSRKKLGWLLRDLGESLCRRFELSDKDTKTKCKEVKHGNKNT